MFFKSCILTIAFVFSSTVFLSKTLAYTNEGVERINAPIVLQLAEKEGLKIFPLERTVKKGLLKLKDKKPKEFNKKLSDGITNDATYQGYLLEVRDGLAKTEKAKAIAKYELFKVVERNWDALKMTVLNTHVEQSFKKFKYELVRNLNKINYKKKDNLGYHFSVGWGDVTVGSNYKSVIWKLKFDAKNDNNKLEEGAEDIQIDESGSSESLPLDEGEQELLDQ